MSFRYVNQLSLFDLNNANTIRQKNKKSHFNAYKIINYQTHKNFPRFFLSLSQEKKNCNSREEKKNIGEVPQEAERLGYPARLPARR